KIRELIIKIQKKIRQKLESKDSSKIGEPSSCDFLKQQFALISSEIEAIAIKRSKIVVLFFEKKDGVLQEWIELLIPGFTPLKTLPRKPFIPKLKSLDLGYESEGKWDVKNSSEDVIAFQFYHLEPFGIQPIQVGSQLTPLMPDYGKEKTLYLGFENLELGSKVTLFVNITSRIQTLKPKSPGLKFNIRYLSSQGWYNLELLEDGTFNFEQSGILSFIVPQDMTDQNSLMPELLYWLRIRDYSNREITVNFIATQAIRVKRKLSSTDDFQLIPTGAIKTPELPLAAIKKVQQPIPSFGGKQKESQSLFYQRVAYRLKTKNRATTVSDIEALVLMQFRSLYSVKAIPMAYLDPTKVGYVKLVLVNSTEFGAPHTYRPLVPIATMRAVLKFLEHLGLPGTRFEITNPDFAVLRIKADIIFAKEEIGQTYCQQLNKELRDFICPWIKDNPHTDHSRNPWSESNIRAFIESRSYVKSVGYYDAQLNLNPIINKEYKQTQDLKLEPTQLIVPDEKHILNYITQNEHRAMNHNTLKTYM
ncbi:MAG: hypothetical protein AAF705_18075, partial [Bacteroidota bacterium]